MSLRKFYSNLRANWSRDKYTKCNRNERRGMGCWGKCHETEEVQNLCPHVLRMWWC